MWLLVLVVAKQLAKLACLSSFFAKCHFVVLAYVHETAICCSFDESIFVAAVMTDHCSGLCNPEETMTKLHADENCTKAATDDLPMMASRHDFNAVGCIEFDENGGINKTLCSA